MQQAFSMLQQFENDSFFVMAGHSRPKDGVASARLCPGHPRLSCGFGLKTWMPGIADRFTQSAQDRLLWPGMTTVAENQGGWCSRLAAVLAGRRCVIGEVDLEHAGIDLLGGI